MPLPNRALSLLLAYQNLVGLSPESLKAVESTVQQYFPGVNLQWQPQGLGVQSPYSVIFAHHAFKESPKDAWGTTLGKRAYIFTDEADQLAGSGSTPLTIDQNLGAITAHELGHALGIQHSPGGIMAPNWPNAAYGRRNAFDKKQLSQIRKQLSRQLTIGGTP